MAKTKTLTFQWEGINKRGQKIEGEMLGENSAIVKAQLRKQGIIPKKIRRKAEGLFGIGGGGGGSKKNKEYRYHNFSSSISHYG